MFAAGRDLDSICALSTPSGHGALAIIRLSGPKALEIGRASAPFLPPKPESHRAYFGVLRSRVDQSDLDEALVTYFAPGRSFTGEETLEFSVHGSSAIIQELLRSLVVSGARAADRGEFTYRAFMNGKLDLIQAESVLALIESQSRRGAQQALNQLRGGLSKEIEFFESEVTWALAHIEADLDFSTEGLQIVSAPEMRRRLDPVRQGLAQWIRSYQQGRLLQEGLRVALVGAPNVGKSSLLNAFLDEDRAIVTEVAGTTRDLIEAPLMVGGLRVLVVDTAGVRESQDVVEKLGIERSEKAAREADFVTLVVSHPAELAEVPRQWGHLDPSRLLIVLNKEDQHGGLSAETAKVLQTWGSWQPFRVISVSAFDRKKARSEWMQVLEAWLEQNRVEDHSVLFQARHHELLVRSLERLEEGLRLVEVGLSPELAAFELKESLLCLQEVLGKSFDDQILDRVFKEFCLGK